MVQNSCHYGPAMGCYWPGVGSISPFWHVYRDSFMQCRVNFSGLNMVSKKLLYYNNLARIKVTCESQQNWIFECNKMFNEPVTVQQDKKYKAASIYNMYKKSR